jgi:hypothetical protein
MPVPEDLKQRMIEELEKGLKDVEDCPIEHINISCLRVM